MTRIVGIGLFRDEDRFVERAIRNVLGFCDELILVDHRSRDETPAILRRLARESRVPTALHRIRDAAESHDLVQPYIGQDVWVFGVDGDEIYDPAGLALFKPRLLDGEFADRWQIKGNVLHTVELAANTSTATGYLSPPNSSMTKLFNFKLIEAWEGETPERLHGPEIRFAEPHEYNQHMLNREHAWDDSPFRCLHLTFIRRSSREQRGLPRRNIKDRNSPRRLPLRMWSGLRERAGFPERSSWKLEHYRQGDLVTVSAAPFFP